MTFLIPSKVHAHPPKKFQFQIPWEICSAGTLEPWAKWGRTYQVSWKPLKLYQVEVSWKTYQISWKPLKAYQVEVSWKSLKLSLMTGPLGWSGLKRLEEGSVSKSGFKEYSQITLMSKWFKNLPLLYIFASLTVWLSVDESGWDGGEVGWSRIVHCWVTVRHWLIQSPTF